jgi:uncharacterized membrane protein (UPF0127 family)
MTAPGASGPSSEAPETGDPAAAPVGASRSTGLTVVSAVLLAAAAAIVVVVAVSALRHKAGKHTDTADKGTVTTTTLVNHPAPAPVGFEAAELRIADGSGKARTWCVLLADVEPLRQQGLMWVDDPKLGGYDGMLFSWPGDTSESFWMRNTPQPLSVAFFRVDGALVSTADMPPCGDRADCPTYPAAGSYRLALEVPKGRLPALGVGPGSKIVVEGSGKACGKSVGT